MRLLTLFLLLAVSLPLWSQTTYKKRFGSSGDEEPRCLEVLSDGSFIVAGSSTGGGLGGQDALLVKFSAAGAVEWSKVLGGSGTEFFQRLYACSDGNFLAVGETNSFGAGGTDIYIVKFDGSGSVIWESTAGGSGEETGRGVCEVSDGYIICGATQSFGGGFWDIFVQKLDFTGAHVWNKAWGGGGGDGADQVFPAGGANVWVTGYTYISSNNHDAFLFRLDGNGAILSAKKATQPLNEGLRCISAGGAGLVGAGGTWSYSGGTQIHPWIISFDNTGNIAWTKRYPVTGGNYEIWDFGITSGGELIFTPFNVNNDTGDAILVKTDAGGNVSWSKSHSYGSSGHMRVAKPTPDGGFLAVGSCTGNGRDLFILKTDGSGNIEECCPTNAGITAIVISPGSLSYSPNSATGPASAAATAADQGLGLTETNLCNGPSCCITDAGTMMPQTLSLCVNQTAVFTHNGDQVLDNNDLLQFILFSNPGDTLGSIIVTSNTPSFTFDPGSMQTGVTYYVAAIAGDNLNGNVDLNDPCLDISNAALLIWRPLPAVVLTAPNPDLCVGNCQTIQATFTGTPPFQLTVSDPYNGNSSFTFNSNSGTFQICAPPGTPAGSMTVQAVALMDANCLCE